jgi:hypothetical protein
VTYDLFSSIDAGPQHNLGLRDREKVDTGSRSFEYVVLLKSMRDIHFRWRERQSSSKRSRTLLTICRRKYILPFLGMARLERAGTHPIYRRAHMGCHDSSLSFNIKVTAREAGVSLSPLHVMRDSCSSPNDRQLSFSAYIDLADRCVL